jgi:oligoribonuclease
MTKEKKEKHTVLAWIDLETTGLDENKGRILEYAVVFTDLELNELACRTNIIPQNVKIARDLMDDYVVEMHTKNKLLGQLEAANRDALQYSDSIEEAEDDILTMLGIIRERVADRHIEVVDHEAIEVDVIFVIAGNTVGFDKRWIKVHMPKLFEALHYRQLDVSCYKVGFPTIFGTGTSAAHRAMADIRSSIEQHRRMRGIINGAARIVGMKIDA